MNTEVRLISELGRLQNAGEGVQDHKVRRRGSGEVSRKRLSLRCAGLSTGEGASWGQVVWAHLASLQKTLILTAKGSCYRVLNGHNVIGLAWSLLLD